MKCLCLFPSREALYRSLRSSILTGERVFSHKNNPVQGEGFGGFYGVKGKSVLYNISYKTALMPSRELMLEGP